MYLSKWTLAAALAILTAGAVWGEETEREKRNAFLENYNFKKAHERLAAVGYLAGGQEQYSAELLYLVSWKDADPEVRSRAFSILARYPDKMGYIAHLSADSFKREKELGVKVEKAVAMENLRYRWAALHELTEFLRTLRWYDWRWYSHRHASGYIAGGIPPTEEGYGVKGEGSGDDEWRRREPLRWRNERELMGHVTRVINRLAGTQMEARPRIDQEIVKWWERRSELWAEYDRKLREKEIGEYKDINWGERVKEMKVAIDPGKDVQPQFLGDPDMVLKGQQAAEAPKPEAPRKPLIEDEPEVRGSGRGVKDLE